MPIPDRGKIWPKLEIDGVDEVRKKLTMGVYAEYKIPIIKEWLSIKSELKDTLEPKPPETAQKIKWILLHGKEHWKILLIGMLVMLVLFIIKFAIGYKKPIADKKMSNKVATKKKENTFPAFEVKFADNSEAYVNITYGTQVNSENIVKAISVFRSVDRIMTSLHSSVQGAIYSVLEQKTIDYVRKNREELSGAIINETKDAQQRCGYDIVHLSILNIKEIKSGTISSENEVSNSQSGGDTGQTYQNITQNNNVANTSIDQNYITSNDLPGDTGWILVGDFVAKDNMYVRGPLYKVTKSNYKDKSLLPRKGEWIKLTAARNIVIADYKTDGLTKKFQPPWKENVLEDDDYTGFKLTKGSIAEVRDVSIAAYPGHPAVVWVRIGVPPR